MPADLTLRVLDIPGLQRRCVPVYESGASGIEGCRGLLAPRVSNSAECVVRWEDRAAGMETGITGGTAVDMTHPFGRFHALLWLRERGHDLRWAENEAEVLAWSVLSVARGGGSIVGILAVWTEGASDSAANYVRENVPESGHAGLLVWHKNALWMLDKPCGQSLEDRAAADRAALAAGYALRNEDSLTLPSLPEVPRV